MDTKRGDDAQDHAPQPAGRTTATPDGKQEAQNYEERDDDRAIEIEDMNSASDEGAN